MYTKFLNFENFYLHSITVQKNRPLFKLLNEKNNLMGKLFLLKYARDEDISDFRRSLSSIIVNHEMLKITYSAIPFT